LDCSWIIPFDSAYCGGHEPQSNFEGSAG
jgi:hypothetical protein